MFLQTPGSSALLLINKTTPAWITAFLLVFRGFGIGLVIQPVLLFFLQRKTVRRIRVTSASPSSSL